MTTAMTCSSSAVPEYIWLLILQMNYHFLLMFFVSSELIDPAVTYSKLTVKTPYVSTANFEQVNTGWISFFCSNCCRLPRALKQSVSRYFMKIQKQRHNNQSIAMELLLLNNSMNNTQILQKTFCQYFLHLSCRCQPIC